jgi:D-apionolactonase
MWSPAQPVGSVQKAVDASPAECQPLTPPESIELRAGPIEASLEAGTLRNVRLFGVEILAGVYAAVRDASWGTIEPAFTRYDVATEHGGFSVQLAASCVREIDQVDIAWRGAIIGRPDGTISFSFDAIVNRPFLRARIGLCVLHPLRLVGSPLEVETPWSHVSGQFPDLVTAHLPFSNMSAIRQDLGRPWEASLEFEGELFQLEDQRAFGDPSFKTFCTPLELPWPIMVDTGTRIRQAVHVRPTLPAKVDGVSRDRRGPRDLDGHRTVRPTVAVGRLIGRRPLIGTHLPPAVVALDQPVLDALRGTRLDHLRVVVVAADAGAEDEVARAPALAADLDLPLELAIVSRPGDPSLSRILGMAAAGPVRLTRLAVFDSQRHTTPEALLADARSAAVAIGLDLMVGGGSRGYLYQLILHGVPAGIDVVEFPMTPQVHAFDDASILGTIASIAAAIRTADSLGGGSPIHIAPLSMRPQFNPDLVDLGGVQDALLPARYDSRQADLLTAVWTLGCIAAIGAAGGAGLTAHEAAGWGGLVSATHRGLPPVPGKPGALFPVGAVIAAVTELGPTAEIRAIRASAGIAALALESRSGRRLLLASTAQVSASLQVRWPLPWSSDMPRAVSLTLDSCGEWAWLPVEAVRASRDLELALPARGILMLDGGISDAS